MIVHGGETDFRLRERERNYNKKKKTGERGATKEKETQSERN